jgi:hypothetical protein
MLRSTKDLENYVISATDGPIGHVKDFYFDDDVWVVRYLIVDTGSWLSSRKVLISPISVRHPDWLKRTLPLSITKEQVRNSPNIDTDKPVSRQNEEQYLGYYGYPYYWGGEGVWGEGSSPYAMVPGNTDDGEGWKERQREIEISLRAERVRHRNDDPNLRSCEAVTGYHLHAIDGEIGHIAGYLIDDESWAIRYVIIDTSNWWLGHKILIAPEWITAVHWSDQTVSVDLGRELIKDAPAYDSSMEWSREMERSLFQHYGRLGYWVNSDVLETEI